MAKRSASELFPDQGLTIDMSPMIDLVFLLLVFFMTSSRLISYLQDPNVEVPIAYEADVAKNIEGRFVINLYADGTLHSADGRDRVNLEEFEAQISQAYRQRPETVLLLRADRRVAHKKVREVVQASVRGGVSDIVFATYQTD